MQNMDGTHHGSPADVRVAQKAPPLDQVYEMSQRIQEPAPEHALL